MFAEPLLRIKTPSGGGRGVEFFLLAAFRGAHGGNAKEGTSGPANPLLSCYSIRSQSLRCGRECFYDSAHHSPALAVLNRELMTPWLKPTERRLKRVRGNGIS